MAEIRDTSAIGTQNLEDQRKLAEDLMKALLNFLSAHEQDLFEKDRIREYFESLGFNKDEIDDIFRSLDYAVDNARTARLDTAAAIRSGDVGLIGAIRNKIIKGNYKEELHDLEYKIPSVVLVNGFPKTDRDGSEITPSQKIDMVKAAITFTAMNFNEGLDKEVQEQDYYGAFKYDQVHINPDGSLWCEISEVRKEYNPLTHEVTNPNAEEHPLGRISIDKNGNVVTCFYGSHGRHIQDNLVALNNYQIHDMWETWRKDKTAEETADLDDDVIDQQTAPEVVDANNDYAVDEEAIPSADENAIPSVDEDDRAGAIPAVATEVIPEADAPVVDAPEADVVPEADGVIPDVIDSNNDYAVGDSEVPSVEDGIPAADAPVVEETAKEATGAPAVGTEISETDAKATANSVIDSNNDYAVGEDDDTVRSESSDKAPADTETADGSAEAKIDNIEAKADSAEVTGNANTEVTDVDDTKTAVDSNSDYKVENEDAEAGENVTGQAVETDATEASEKADSEKSENGETLNAEEVETPEEYKDINEEIQEALKGETYAAYTEQPTETPSYETPQESYESSQSQTTEYQSSESEEQRSGAILGGAAESHAETPEAPAHAEAQSTPHTETQSTPAYQNETYAHQPSYTAAEAPQSQTYATPGYTRSGSVVETAMSSEEYNRQQVREALDKTRGYTDTAVMTAYNTPTSGSYGYNEDGGATSDRNLTMATIGKYGASDPNTLVKTTEATGTVMKQGSAIGHSGIADGYKELTKNNYALALSALSSQRAASYARSYANGDVFGFNLVNHSKGILGDSTDASVAGNVVGKMNSLIGATGGRTLQPANTKQADMLRNEYSKALDKTFGYKGGAAVSKIAKGDLSVADIQHALNARGIKTTEKDALAIIKFSKREENQRRLGDKHEGNKHNLKKELGKAAIKNSAIGDAYNEFSKINNNLRKIYTAGAIVYKSYNIVVPYVSSRFYNTKVGKAHKEAVEKRKADAAQRKADAAAKKAKEKADNAAKKAEEKARKKAEWEQSERGKRTLERRKVRADRRALRRKNFENSRLGRGLDWAGNKLGKVGRGLAKAGNAVGSGARWVAQRFQRMRAGLRKVTAPVRGIWNLVTKGPAALLDFVKTKIKQLLIKILGAIAPPLLTLMGGFLVVFIVLTMITSFFGGAYTGDEELSIANSNMGQAWTIMEKMEDSWMMGLGDLSGINTMYAFSTGTESKLADLNDWFGEAISRLNGTSGIQGSDDKYLYYSRELLTAEQYLDYEKYEGAPTLRNTVTTDNGMVYDQVYMSSDNANMFVIDRFNLGEAYAKKVEYFDGGIYVDVQGADGSLKTSNIKEILCMAAVYFMDEDSPTGNTDAMDYGTWVAGATNHFKRGWNAFWFDQEQLQMGATQSAKTIAQYAGEVFMDSHDVSYDLTLMYLPTISDPVYYRLKNTEVAGEIQNTGLMSMIAGTGYMTVADSSTLKEIASNPWLKNTIGQYIITSGAVYNGNMTFMEGEYAASHAHYKNALNTQYDIAIVCPFGDIGGCTSLVPSEDDSLSIGWRYNSSGEKELYVINDTGLRYLEAGPNALTPTYYRSDFDRLDDLLFGSTEERQALVQTWMNGDGNYFPLYATDDNGNTIAVNTTADGSGTLCCLANTIYELHTIFTQSKEYKFTATQVIDLDASNVNVFPSGCWSVNGKSYAPGDTFDAVDYAVVTDSGTSYYDSADAAKNAAHGYFNGTSFSYFESVDCPVDFGGMKNWDTIGHGEPYGYKVTHAADTDAEHPNNGYLHWTVTIYGIGTESHQDSRWVEDTSDEEEDTTSTTTATTTTTTQTTGHWEDYTNYKYVIYSKTYEFVHTCTGMHSCRYCGGHFRVEARGYVCGFDERWLSEEKQAAAEEEIEESGEDRPVIAGIVQEGTFKYLADDQNLDVYGYDVAADIINTITLGSNELAGLEANYRLGVTIDPEWCKYKGLTDAEVSALQGGNPDAAILISYRDQWMADSYGERNGAGNYTDKILRSDPGNPRYITNLFEKDAFVAHSVIMNGWENWTESNISEVLLKYQADWQEYYGIDISDYYGGQPVPRTIQENVVDQLNYMRECGKNGTTTWAECIRYAAIPDDEWEIRMEVVKECLKFAGSGSYSQAHHGHGFLGLDTNENGEEYNCYATDCTGFGSFAERRSMHNCIGGFGGNITRDNGSTMTDIYVNGNRLPLIEACSFSNSGWEGTSGSTALPGDLITLGSDRNTHVMVYIGNISPLWNADYHIQSSQDGGYTAGQILNFEVDEDMAERFRGSSYDKNDFEDLSSVELSISWIEQYHMPMIVHMTGDCYQENLASSESWADKIENALSDMLTTRGANMNYGGVRFNRFGGNSSAWTEQCQVIHMPGYDLYSGRDGNFQGQGDYGVYNYIPD